MPSKDWSLPPRHRIRPSVPSKDSNLSPEHSRNSLSQHSESWHAFKGFGPFASASIIRQSVPSKDSNLSPEHVAKIVRLQRVRTFRLSTQGDTCRLSGISSQTQSVRPGGAGDRYPVLYPPCGSQKREWLGSGYSENSYAPDS